MEYFTRYSSTTRLYNLMLHLTFLLCPQAILKLGGTGPKSASRLNFPLADYSTADSAQLALPGTGGSSSKAQQQQRRSGGGGRASKRRRVPAAAAAAVAAGDESDSEEGEEEVEDSSEDDEA
jgi:hypothetical protein